MSLRHLISPEQRAALRGALGPRNMYGSGGGYIVASKRMILRLVRLDIVTVGHIPTTGWLTLAGYDIARKLAKPLRSPKELTDERHAVNETVRSPR
jgi:hypothetical protein